MSTSSADASVPARMEAVVIEEHGRPEVLKFRTIPRPEPGPEEVLVRVAATALNRADLLQRRGLYPPPPPVPAHEVPGLEFAGTVATVGARVTTARPGDRVCGLLPGGGYAGYVVTHERLLMPVPRGISLNQAAAIPEVWCTAYDALVDRAGLGSGERLLVHAAGSGVGTAAIQLATALGATAYGTVRSPWKVEQCTALGAREVLVFAVEDGAGPVVELGGPDGFDVILDLVGGPYLAVDLAAAALEGRIILVGLLAGTSAELELGTLLRKRLLVWGTTLRTRPVHRKMLLTEAVNRRVIPLFAAGRLVPVIDRTFPLAEAAVAHAYLEANRSCGKIVLVLDEETAGE